MAASLTGLEKLIAFLESNPYTVNTARRIALARGPGGRRGAEGIRICWRSAVSFKRFAIRERMSTVTSLPADDKVQPAWL